MFLKISAVGTLGERGEKEWGSIVSKSRPPLMVSQLSEGGDIQEICIPEMKATTIRRAQSQVASSKQVSSGENKCCRVSKRGSSTQDMPTTDPACTSRKAIQQHISLWEMAFIKRDLICCIVAPSARSLLSYLVLLQTPCVTSSA